jgi:hypothetical protein
VSWSWTRTADYGGCSSLDYNLFRLVIGLIFGIGWMKVMKLFLRIALRGIWENALVIPQSGLMELESEVVQRVLEYMDGKYTTSVR